jgi:bifunctional DNA-binding transcriptional regulator/antitoxin component of YhaV-PrlF toxin-antitoxin module
MSDRRTRLLSVATVSAKGQITLPRVALDSIGARPGDRLSIVRAAAGLIVRRIGPSVVEQTAGSLARHIRRRP